MHQYASECINMHLNASKCIIMYAEWIISMFCAWNFNLKNSNFFGWKWPIFFLSAQNASICIRMHQNVCRMKCANVLCTKISKNGFILHLKGLKSAKYLLHFVMEDPVFFFSTSRIISAAKGLGYFRIPIILIYYFLTDQNCGQRG